MKYIGYIGFVMFMVGGAAVDGNQIVAAVLALVGMTLVYADYRLQERRENECEK